MERTTNSKNRPNKKGAVSFWIDQSTNVRYNKKVNNNCTYFASEFEFKVWSTLQCYLPDALIEQQYKVCIKPSNGLTPPLYWRLDFRVHYRNLMFYVEAKGGWVNKTSSDINELIYKIALLECNKPEESKRLILVKTDKPFAVGNMPSYTLDEFAQLLKGLVLKNDWIL